MEHIYKFKSKIWKYPGFGGWHFVTLDKKLSKTIKNLGLLTGGFGSHKVKAILGKTEWMTSIFPTKEKEYLLAIKAQVRKKELVKRGDTVEIKIIIQ
jgi:hypothetical protein